MNASRTPTLDALERKAEAMRNVRAAAAGLVEYAATLGVVLTIEQRPLMPPAMGYYETIVSVREARHG